MDDVKKTALEAVKEAGRVVLLAILPVLVTSLEKNQLDWRSVTFVAVLALLRGADKWVHEWGKVNGEMKGITPF